VVKQKAVNHGDTETQRHRAKKEQLPFPPFYGHQYLGLFHGLVVLVFKVHR
jgi:hypothetical protein